MTSPSAHDFLITGGAGFIGASLAARLRAEGHTVACLDVIPFERLDALKSDAGLTCVTGDVGDVAIVDRWVQACRRVVHLAAVVGVDEYMRDPERVLDVNILGTRNVLRSCLAHGRSVLFTSTSEIYGCNTSRLSETQSRVYGSYLSPRWSYALSKACGEQYAHALARRGLSHVTVRFFNVYGPGLDRPGSGRVVSRFLGQIAEGQPLTLVDGGQAVRAFCFVDEAIEATVQLALNMGPDVSWMGRAFNVGREEPVTMRELAERMIRLSGHTAGTLDVSGVEHFGAGFEDIPRRVPDVSALASELGFYAEIELDEGLRRTLASVGLLAD
jgi:nucleoside-diphosphate-sugar epimerase